MSSALAVAGALYDGLIDGDYGPATEAAIEEVQREAGIEVDGAYGQETAAALNERDQVEALGEKPVERVGDTSADQGDDPSEVLRPGSRGPAVRGLQRRLAQLGYRRGRADGDYGAETASACIVNVSTGSGETYDLPGGGSAVAHTPAGRFTVSRNVEGIVEAPLGSLYKPLYFDQGWAVHAAASVPGYPASHGCVRTSEQDQDFVSRTLGEGLGRDHSREEPRRARPGPAGVLS